MAGDFLVRWKSVLNQSLGEGKWDLDNIDTSKVIDFLEEDLGTWQNKQRALKSTLSGGETTLSEAEAKAIATRMHHTFVAHKHEEFSLDILSAFYHMDHSVDLADAKNDIRAVAKKLSTTFSIGRGPAPQVRRLINSKGKPTGMQPFEFKERGSSPNVSGGSQKAFMRFMGAQFTPHGINKQQFEAAKKALGKDAVTVDEVKEYLGPGAFGVVPSKKPDMSKLPTVNKSPSAELFEEEEEEEPEEVEEEEEEEAPPVVIPKGKTKTGKPVPAAKSSKKVFVEEDE